MDWEMWFALGIGFVSTMVLIGYAIDKMFDEDY